MSNSEFFTGPIHRHATVWLKPLRTWLLGRTWFFRLRVGGESHGAAGPVTGITTATAR